MERKLTAIFCADVFGYSRLTGEDEEATHRTLRSYRQIIDALIEQHRGRFVHSAGDSVLAEFVSVVNAVQFAVEIQTMLKAENATLPAERRMEFRIGINLGDVIADGVEIYGDGVNVAARLENLAEPGTIFISGSVREQLGNKLKLEYSDLGEQSVKNILHPVRVFRVLPDAGARAESGAMTARAARKYVRRGAFSLVGLGIIAATILIVQHVSIKPPHSHASIPPPTNAVTEEKPELPLPSIPSIAVLPFANLSGDPQQEYFSDGITDDLITDLSRVPGLFVIDRGSSFTYKGKPATAQQVGRELGVKYVLEGSARKEANRVRINVQLADAGVGDQVWSQRYDRGLRDIFAVQDEVVQSLVITLNLQLTALEHGYITPQHTKNLEAYDYYLRGLEYHNITPTPARSAEGRKMFEKALELDPSYADAYTALSWSYLRGYLWQFDNDPSTLDRAAGLAIRRLRSTVPKQWPTHCAGG
jgi:TolB-like protein/class 3 adenylate cyclase